MRELAVGNRRSLSSDLGPVITAEAADGVIRHNAALCDRGFAGERHAPTPGTARGTFVPPTLIEIGRVADVEREVLGPVLHVPRYQRTEFDVLTSAIAFSLRSRIDQTIVWEFGRVRAGNRYANRGLTGAGVGVQRLGGSSLSGTGPKAGEPLRLDRRGPARCDPGAHVG